jgi:hypothetical protein
MPVGEVHSFKKGSLSRDCSELDSRIFEGFATHTVHVFLWIVSTPANGMIDRTAPSEVRTHTGQNHSNGMFSLVARERRIEQVNGQSHSPGLNRVCEVQQSSCHCQFFVGRNDTDHVWLQTHGIGRLEHLHGCCALQNFNEHRLPCRVQMLDHNVGQAAQPWHMSQELLKHDQSPSRRPQTHGTNRT